MSYMLVYSSCFQFNYFDKVQAYHQNYLRNFPVAIAITYYKGPTLVYCVYA